MLSVAGICLLWNLVFTMTEYRPPAEKVVDLYVSGFGDQEGLNAWLENVRQTEMPDMEQMLSVFMTNDAVYGNVQLTTYIYAGEGDLYLLSASDFQNMASGSAFMPLEDSAEVLAAADACGINLERGWRTNPETRERHLYGIPAGSLEGFRQFGLDPTDQYLSILVRNGNDENSLKLMQIIIRQLSGTGDAQEGTADS